MESAAERKRKRLEAWKQRQQQRDEATPPPPPPPPAAAPLPASKVSLKLNMAVASKKKKVAAAVAPRRQIINNRKPKAPAATRNPFGTVDDDDDDEGDDSDDDEHGGKKRGQLSLGLGFMLTDNDDDRISNVSAETSNRSTDPPDEEAGGRPAKRRKKGRWDAAASTTAPVSTTANAAPPEVAVTDALDKFMEKLEAGALGSVATQVKEPGGTTELLSIDVGGSMMRVPTIKQQPQPSPVFTSGVITSEEIAKLTSSSSTTTRKVTSTSIKISQAKLADPEALYTASDWESDAQDATASAASEPETDDEEEDKARRALIEALKSAPGPAKEEDEDDVDENGTFKKPSLAAEVKSEKLRKEQRLRDLEREAEEARALAERSEAPEFGRLFNDIEGGIMEEAERNLDAAMAAPDALQVLAELNKKKELKSVDHSQVDYIPFKKNLYIVPRSLAKLSSDDVANIRAKIKVKVRGHGAPAPVSSFEQCGLSERILKVMEKQNISRPFPIQAQCLPCIMAGRDTIGIAKTGSGKTLSYLLPLLRHILDQPPLGPNESGPIGLILAPARELAYQIHLVCKSFTKSLGLKSAAVYGGASVAEQIADLKRGAHIVVATPGRLIDILTMQSGKLLSLQRVTYVVMDEADRMFDMGFAPQISAIMAAVRPDRQTLLFSATFPKSVETLARKSLKYPVEVIVGGRSVASDNITQYAELVEEEDKFFRLLQLLGENVDETHKAIVFVDTQNRADQLFEQLLRNGYACLSLHGGKEQEDRDSTISDFKRKDGPNVLVATGVAGRGLDVPSCSCVVNFSCPNHLEAYVHQVGRTGRARNKGVSYTMVNSTDEAKYAPNVVRAMSEAGQSENIAPELKALSDSFKEKVQKGEEKWASSGYKGRGYTYDASEMNEAQKVAQAEKRQALIEAGLLDPDDEEPADAVGAGTGQTDSDGEGKPPEHNEAEKALDLQTKLTPALLALPGMKDAILKKAGIIRDTEKDDDDPTLGRPVKRGDNHWLQEFEINDYPREARWKVTQKETGSRLNDEFRTAVTLKGEYFGPGRTPGEGERRLYLHLEATSEHDIKMCVEEIKRILNEETLRGAAKAASGGGGGGHKYSVLGK